MLAFGHRQEAASALTGTYQPASVLPAVRRQVPCQFLGQRQICADLDRHPHVPKSRCSLTVMLDVVRRLQTRIIMPSPRQSYPSGRKDLTKVGFRG